MTDSLLKFTTPSAPPVHRPEVFAPVIFIDIGYGDAFRPPYNVTWNDLDSWTGNKIVTKRKNFQKVLLFV